MGVGLGTLAWWKAGEDPPSPAEFDKQLYNTTAVATAEMTFLLAELKPFAMDGLTPLRGWSELNRIYSIPLQIVARDLAEEFTYNGGGLAAGLQKFLQYKVFGTPNMMGRHSEVEDMPRKRWKHMRFLVICSHQTGMVRTTLIIFSGQ